VNPESFTSEQDGFPQAAVMNVDEFEDYLDLQLSALKKQCTVRLNEVGVDQANVVIIGGGRGRRLRDRARFRQSGTISSSSKRCQSSGWVRARAICASGRPESPVAFRRMSSALTMSSQFFTSPGGGANELTR